MNPIKTLVLTDDKPLYKKIAGLPEFKADCEAWGIFLVPMKSAANGRKVIEETKNKFPTSEHVLLSRKTEEESRDTLDIMMKSAVPLFCQVADLGDIKTFADFQNAIGRADPPLSIAQIPAVDPLAPSTPKQPGIPLPTSMNPDALRRLYIPGRDTDLGNAERFVKVRGKDVRYTREMGWLVWTGNRWKPDDTAVRELAKKAIIPEVLRETAAAALSQNLMLSKILANWAKRSEGNERITAALALASSADGVYLPVSDFDKDPWAFNCMDGTIDLKTGTIRPHDPKNLITRLSRVVFDPVLKCPIWEKTLDRVFDGRKDLVEFFQRAVGYTLTAETREQTWFFLCGRGQNGKSTIVEAISKLMGEYSHKAQTETFMLSKMDRAGGAPSPDIAAMKTARFVYASETEEGRSLAVGKLKDMTGGETMTARELHRAPFQFRPQWKLWISGNHKPTIRDTTISTWRRIALVPFEIEIPDSEKDDTLPAKLEKELPGILAWAVRGCLAWQKDGLKRPAEVQKAVASYRESQDPLAAFIAECCLVSPHMFTSARAIFDGYAGWAGKSSDFPNIRKFNEALEEKGFPKRHGHSNTVVFDGIRLSPTMVNEVNEVNDF